MLQVSNHRCWEKMRGTRFVRPTLQETPQARYNRKLKEVWAAVGARVQRKGSCSSFYTIDEVSPWRTFWRKPFLWPATIMYDVWPGVFGVTLKELTTYPYRPVLNARKGRWGKQWYSQSYDSIMSSFSYARILWYMLYWYIYPVYLSLICFNYTKYSRETGALRHLTTCSRQGSHRLSQEISLLSAKWLTIHTFMI